MSTTRFMLTPWGVRGSTPVPGRSTLAFGGNTTCLEIRCGDELIIIDAGTGLRPLGNALMGQGLPIKGHILFSHLHWDHIQGLPFFVPGFIKGNSFTIVSARYDGGDAQHALNVQMTRPCFPVPFSILQADYRFRVIMPGDEFPVGDATVKTGTLRHPGGSMAYRIDYAGHSVVNAVDTEHPSEGMDKDLVRLAQGADLLIYDSAYTEDEYHGRAGPAKAGFGHSTWEQGIQIAQAAGVQYLGLAHHDPSHDDQTMLAIHQQAQAAFPGAFALYEGQQIDLLNLHSPPPPPTLPTF